MNEIAAMSAVGSATAAPAPTQVTVTQLPTASAAANSAANTGTTFDSMLKEAVTSLDDKVAKADRMVAEFAIDESTPIHHVTIALEEARMAVELATQVRQRLTEGYRELMNMQL